MNKFTYSKSKLVLLLFVLMSPLYSYAAFFSQTKNLIKDVGSIIDLLIPIVAALALLYFFWGLAKFILHADNEDKREEGKNVMKWGIVALFVMVSIWGITSFIQGELLGGADTSPFDTDDIFQQSSSSSNNNQVPIPPNPRDSRPPAPGDSDFPSGF